MMMGAVREVLLFATLLFVVVSASGQKDAMIAAAALKPHIVKLADDKMEGRGAGYKGERLAADYIAAQFKNAGLKPAGTKGYFQEFRFHAYHPVTPWEIKTSRNVLGLVQGSDPELKNEVVVVGAHYDGQGRVGQADPTRQFPPKGAPADDIWNSANDNASSVAALIEMARMLKRSPPKRTVLFAAFGAEEHGMTGSIYYVNHPVFPIERNIAMINLEKLGRSPERPLVVAGVMSSKAWPAAVDSASKAAETRIVQNQIAFPDSDHYPFSSRGVPSVLVIVSTNADGHLPTDSADKIDFDRTAKAAQFALGLVREVADSVDGLDFVRSPMLDPGLIAHLATGAEADVSGIENGRGGLKVTGVIFGMPADKAGIREGDLILSMGTRQFAREEPLAALMAGFQDLLQGKLGVSIPMSVLRNKQRIELTLHLR